MVDPDVCTSVQVFFIYTCMLYRWLLRGYTPSFSVSHQTGVWTWPDFIHLTGMSHV